MKTKITLALAMIGLSATAFAGAPGNNMTVPTGTPVIAPDSTGTWSFGLEALYMESNTNFQYATFPTLETTGETEVDNQSVANDWNWGGEADISYMFPGSSRDVSASYTYLNLDGNDNVTSPANIYGVGGLINITDLTPFDTAKGDVDQTLNAATLTFGQLFTIGNVVSLHPFGGVQFANIDTTEKANYYGDSGAVPVETGLTSSFKGDSDFTGAGPRAGIDGSVNLGSGFSVIGTFAGALLVGNMSSQVEYHGEFPTTDELEEKNDSYTALVPELDAKLGLNYLYVFDSKTSMNFQVGYEVVNYFNAVSDDAADTALINSVNNTSDFNYNGPYLRVQLNVA